MTVISTVKIQLSKPVIHSSTAHLIIQRPPTIVDLEPTTSSGASSLVQVHSPVLQRAPEKTKRFYVNPENAIFIFGISPLSGDDYFNFRDDIYEKLESYSTNLVNFTVIRLDYAPGAQGAFVHFDNPAAAEFFVNKKRCRIGGKHLRFYKFDITKYAGNEEFEVKQKQGQYATKSNLSRNVSAPYSKSDGFNIMKKIKKNKLFRSDSGDSAFLSRSSSLEKKSDSECWRRDSEEDQMSSLFNKQIYI